MPERLRRDSRTSIQNPLDLYWGDPSGRRFIDINAPFRVIQINPGTNELTAASITGVIGKQAQNTNMKKCKITSFLFTVPPVYCPIISLEEETNHSVTFQVRIITMNSQYSAINADDLGGDIAGLLTGQKSG